MTAQTVDFLAEYAPAGDGVQDTHTALVAANTLAAGALLTLPTPPTSYRVSTNTTLSAALDVQPGGFNIDTAVTLAINGNLRAGPYQIFGVLGTASLGVGSVQAVLPEWWGASGTASAATNTAAFTAAAIAANGAGASLLLQPGVSYAGAISLPTSASNLHILAFGAKLKPTGTNTGLVGASVTGVHVHGLEIDASGQTGTAHGAYFSASTDVGLHGVHIHNTHDQGVFFDGGTDLSTDMACEFDHCGLNGVYARNFTGGSFEGNFHDCTAQSSHGVYIDGAAYAWSDAYIAGRFRNFGSIGAGGGAVAATSHLSNAAIRGKRLALNIVAYNSYDGHLWLNCDEVSGQVTLDTTVVGWGIEIQESRWVNLHGVTRNSHGHGVFIHQPTVSLVPTEYIDIDLVSDGSATADGLNITVDSTSGGQLVQHIQVKGQYTNNAGWGMQFRQTADHITVAPETQCTDNVSGTINAISSGTNVRIYGDKGTGSTLTPGASPWTYTAGPRPETLYFAGGTGVTVNVTGFSAGLSTLPLAVQLDPNQAIAVVYSTVPTVNRDIH